MEVGMFRGLFGLLQRTARKSGLAFRMVKNLSN